MLKSLMLSTVAVLSTIAVASGGIMPIDIDSCSMAEHYYSELYKIQTDETYVDYKPKYRERILAHREYILEAMNECEVE